MTEPIKEAINRIRRIRLGIEKSQDIYGVALSENATKAEIHQAAIQVKRMMLNDERAVIDAALAEHGCGGAETESERNRRYLTDNLAMLLARLAFAVLRQYDARLQKDIAERSREFLNCNNLNGNVIRTQMEVYE